MSCPFTVRKRTPVCLSAPFSRLPFARKHSCNVLPTTMRRNGQGGCFITFSSARCPAGDWKASSHCVWRLQRKLLSLTQLGSFLRVQRWEVETLAGKPKGSLAHVLMSGSLGEVAGVHLCHPLHYRSQGVLP